MKTLPPRANLNHLKKQAKTLLRLYREGDRAAIARFAESLPSAAHHTSEEIIGLGLRLHDAQSCIAREYGFASWTDLSVHVEARSFLQGDRADLIRRWLALAYGGDVTGNYDAARPHLAARLLQEQPDVLAGNVDVACAAGTLSVIKQAIALDPGWVNRAGGALNLPPLAAVTHSRLGQLPEFMTQLRSSAQVLLEVGANPNQSIGNRFPPASLAAPDEKGQLSALYGAAGVNRDPVLTEMLLNAGADPNDNESLYHSLENPDCTRVLLQHGVRIAGTNALRRALDMPEPAAIELLLAHGADPNEPAGEGPTKIWGAPLLRAIALRRSPHHIAALLAAGADPSARTPDGISAYRLAMQAGLTDVAQLLRSAGSAESLTPAEAFVAACAGADVATARRIQTQYPELPGSLSATQLRLMPDAAAWGSSDAVKAMVECGWPIDVRGGDWDATALNHAVFRGDPELAGFLLAHGANWREEHGFGSDVLGTLSWASLNEPAGISDPDWIGCVRVLMAHSLPRAERDPSDPERVLIDDRPMRFSEGVTEALLEGSSAPSEPS